MPRVLRHDRELPGRPGRALRVQHFASDDEQRDEHQRPAGREPASADMVCPWFSMTKIVTATLAKDP